MPWWKRENTGSSENPDTQINAHATINLLPLPNFVVGATKFGTLEWCGSSRAAGSLWTRLLALNSSEFRVYAVWVLYVSPQHRVNAELRQGGASEANKKQKGREESRPLL
jgi:hypothetical protein